MKSHKKTFLIFTLVLLVSAGGSLVQAATKSPPAGSSLEQRVTQRKSEQNIKLEERDATRLQKECGEAQTVVNGLQQRLNETVNNRKKTYNAIDAKIWVAIGQHKLAGQDTFALEKQHNTYNKQVNAFDRLTGEYLQTLDDMVVVNCQSDVVGFKALLETARVYLKQIRTQSEKIDTQVVNNVKPELTSLGQKL